MPDFAVGTLLFGHLCVGTLGSSPTESEIPALPLGFCWEHKTTHTSLLVSLLHRLSLQAAVRTPPKQSSLQEAAELRLHPVTPPLHLGLAALKATWDPFAEAFLPPQRSRQ